MEPKQMADLSILFDFYGPLLTESQQEILHLCCNQDLSFSEISKNLGVSRQAVYEILKQSQKKLYNFEEKLKIIKERNNLRDSIQRLSEELNLLDENNYKEIIIKIKNKIKELLEGI